MFSKVVIVLTVLWSAQGYSKPKSCLANLDQTKKMMTDLMKVADCGYQSSYRCGFAVIGPGALIGKSVYNAKMAARSVNGNTVRCKISQIPLVKKVYAWLGISVAHASGCGNLKELKKSVLATLNGAKKIHAQLIDVRGYKHLDELAKETPEKGKLINTIKEVMKKAPIKTGSYVAEEIKLKLWGREGFRNNKEVIGVLQNFKGADKDRLRDLERNVRHAYANIGEVGHGRGSLSFIDYSEKKWRNFGDYSLNRHLDDRKILLKKITSIADTNDVNKIAKVLEYLNKNSHMLDDGLKASIVRDANLIRQNYGGTCNVKFNFFGLLPFAHAKSCGIKVRGVSRFPRPVIGSKFRKKGLFRAAAKGVGKKFVPIVGWAATVYGALHIPTAGRCSDITKNTGWARLDEKCKVVVSAADPKFYEYLSSIKPTVKDLKRVENESPMFCEALHAIHKDQVTAKQNYTCGKKDSTGFRVSKLVRDNRTFYITHKGSGLSSVKVEGLDVNPPYEMRYNNFGEPSRVNVFAPTTYLGSLSSITIRNGSLASTKVDKGTYVKSSYNLKSKNIEESQHPEANSISEYVGLTQSQITRVVDKCKNGQLSPTTNNSGPGPENSQGTSI